MVSGRSVWDIERAQSDHNNAAHELLDPTNNGRAAAARNARRSADLKEIDNI